jgi:hypothetical protein
VTRALRRTTRFRSRLAHQKRAFSIDSSAATQ